MSQPRRFAYGFSPRKRRFLRGFVGAARAIRNPRRLRAGDVLYLWGSAPVPEGAPEGVAVWRVEDGFLRSVGLGAGLAAPLSWVIDRDGIYYDPSRPSELETLLNRARFTGGHISRAAAIREKIVAHGLSKYNVGAKGKWRRSSPGQTILVPGQVEDDASIRMGAVGVSTNMGLLHAVRVANPDAHIIYKPHPDVVHGLRRGDDSQAAKWANEIVIDANISDVLQQVDEVHVMTSLAGFEALLRGKPVTCHGQPFYSGWGLTRDMIPNPRRNRTLTLNELLAGALILYPSYLHPKTGRLATVEDVIDGLVQQSVKGPTLMDFLKMKFMQMMVAR